MASIYCIIYGKLKHITDINLNTLNIYHLILKHPDFNKHHQRNERYEHHRRQRQGIAGKQYPAGVFSGIVQN